MDDLKFEYGSLNEVCSSIIQWNKGWFKRVNEIHDNVFFLPKNISLYEVALLADNKAKAVILEQGGKNYHPRLLLNDAFIPTVSGISKDDLASSYFLFSSRNEAKGSEGRVKILANIGHQNAVQEAKKSGASGIGIFRTEFTAVRSVYKWLLTKSGNIFEDVNEADIIYSMAKDPHAAKVLLNDFIEVLDEAARVFPEYPVIVRTLDIPRSEYDLMGLRGVRRCLLEGGSTLRLIFKSIAITSKKRDKKFGVLVPLVSNYNEIRSAVRSLNDSGLYLSKDNAPPNGKIVDFGWKIESPVSVLNLEYWIKQFKQDFKCFPAYLGVGSNDLTQFTLATDRNIETKGHEENKLYNEFDISNLKLFFHIFQLCKLYKIQLVWQGEAAANPTFCKLLLDNDFWPSVSISKLSTIQPPSDSFDQAYNSLEDFLVDVLKEEKKTYSNQVFNSIIEDLIKIYRGVIFNSSS